MKRAFFTLTLTFFSVTLFAIPYYSERRLGPNTYIFKGNISEKDEPEARSLENLYVEMPRNRAQYRYALEMLGVEITIISNHHGERSQLPSEVLNPDLPEGVKG